MNEIPKLCLDGKEHDWFFDRTIEDWFDGDETDVYKCNKCNIEKRVYIPR